MGIRFHALSATEKSAVADYVREEYDKLVFQHPTDYVTRNAQADPEAWQKSLQELIASDRERVKEITRGAQHAIGESNKGFTLIELSIVLVIIGLVIGGVLVGQTLVSAAAVRAQISQIEKYSTAANTFKGKYGYLPGDIKDPDASNFGFQPRGPYAGEGDGNGVIEGITSNGVASNNGLSSASGEAVMFWADLSKVNLIDGTFGTASPTGTPFSSSTGIGLYLPAAKVGNSNYVYLWSRSGTNYFAISTVLSIDTPNVFSTTGITVQQAYNIDQKIDDGVPTTGRVTTQYNNGQLNWTTGYPYVDSGPIPVAGHVNIASAPANCFDDNNGGYAYYQYSLSQSGGVNPNCALSFQFQ